MTQDDLPSWMSTDWTVARQGSRVAVVRRDFARCFRRHGLIRGAEADAGDLSPEARVFRPSGGRGPLVRVPAGPLGEAVVRMYRRGGLPAKLSESRYLLGDRAFVELEVTVRLRAAGVPAVEPLAAVQAEHRPGYSAALVTRRVPDAPPAPDVLAREDGRRGARRAALRRMGHAARRLHGAGGHHPDLNAHNFLLPRGREGPAVLVDFDRARKLAPPLVPLPGPLAASALRRLRRSLRKLELDGALRAWDAFEEGYRGRGSHGGAR